MLCPLCRACESDSFGDINRAELGQSNSIYDGNGLHPFPSQSYPGVATTDQYEGPGGEQGRHKHLCVQILSMIGRNQGPRNGGADQRCHSHTGENHTKTDAHLLQVKRQRAHGPRKQPLKCSPYRSIDDSPCVKPSQTLNPRPAERDDSCGQAGRDQ